MRPYPFIRIHESVSSELCLRLAGHLSAALAAMLAPLGRRGSSDGRPASLQGGGGGACPLGAPGACFKLKEQCSFVGAPDSGSFGALLLAFGESRQRAARELAESRQRAVRESSESRQSAVREPSESR